MPRGCYHIPTLLFFALLSACSEEGTEVDHTSNDAEQGDADTAVEPDDQRDAGQEDEPTEGDEAGTDSSPSETDLPDAGAGEDAGGGGPAADASPHNLGSKCHDFDFDAVSPLIAAQIVDVLPPAEGGTIVLGTYDLVSEEQAVADDATAEEAGACTQYSGPYRERLVITADQWLRLVRLENSTMGRESFEYQVENDEIVRTQLCPEPDPSFPPYAPAKYTASDNLLVLFVQLNRDSLPDGLKVCEYAYTYKRMP